MPIPASLIASIVSAILEAATQNIGAPPPQTYENYISKHMLPPEAKLGVMLPPAGNGMVTIDGAARRLSPAAQFRNAQNLIVQPMTIQGNRDIVYINDSYGSVYRIWMLSQAELSSIQQN